MDLTQIILSVFEADLPSLDICQQSDKMDFWHDLVKHERDEEIDACIASPTCLDPLILIASTFDIHMNYKLMQGIVHCTERHDPAPSSAPPADDQSRSLITSVPNACELIHLQALSNEEFDLLREINNSEKVTQRELATAMGFSLGKLNYCLAKLKKKGLVKIQNFKKSKNKLNYLYILTPKGILTKTKLTLDYIDTKKREYDELVKELKRDKKKIK